MVLSFQKSTAQAIVNAFAGAPIVPDSPDFADAVGELANMIAGSAKTSFGGATSISVPSIILGPGHTIARLHDVPCLIIPCQTRPAISPSKSTSNPLRTRPMPAGKELSP